MLKKILLGIIGLAIVLALVGFLLPREVHVERSIVIDRPASVVFATVNSFQRFDEWSPWQELDPNMKQGASGPRSGVGATLTWSGNDKVGTGTQKITAVEPDRTVTTELAFDGMTPAKAEFRLAPAGTGTQVTWTMDSDMGTNPIGRYFGLMLDGMIGKDYERGLTKLKAVVEKLPAVDIAGLGVEEVQLTAQPILVVSKITALDTPSVTRGYEEAYAEIGAFMKKHRLNQVGPPLGIDGPMTATSMEFQPGMAVDRAVVASEGNVKVLQSHAGRALKTTHVGSYDELGTTYERLAAWLQANGYEMAGPSFAFYLDDPAKTAEAVLRTEIYWPVK